MYSHYCLNFEIVMNFSKINIFVTWFLSECTAQVILGECFEDIRQLPPKWFLGKPFSIVFTFELMALIQDIACSLLLAPWASVSFSPYGDFMTSLEKVPLTFETGHTLSS